MTSIRIVTAVVLGAAALVPRCPAAERLVWFGTYTGPGTTSQGIYVSRFDDERGTLTTPEPAAAVRNPSFLARHPRLPVLYAISEIADFDGTPAGGVASFTIDERTGTLTRTTEQPSGGAGPCHVCVDRQGTVVLAANYGGGSVICFGLDAAGGLQRVAAGGFVQHARNLAAASGGDPAPQQAPRAHSVDVTSDGRFACVCDLGLDELIVYAVDRERATLAPHATAALQPGAGPRHLAIHPDGRRGWCVNERNLTVTGFTFDPEAGRPVIGGTLSTLPADVTERKGLSTAEIAVHPAGKFLYASNRGHDSIAMFRIVGDTPGLEFLGTEPTRAKSPRHFAIDPSGKFLLVAGQNADTVTVFTIDAETGRLAFTGHSIAVPAPVCILFGEPR